MVKERTPSPGREAYALDCPQCERGQVAKVVHEYDHSEGISNGDRTLVVLLRCDGCGEPFLGMMGGIWVGDYPGRSGFEWDDVPLLLYPSSRDELDAAVPKAISASFREACKCLTAKTWTASAIMCRRTIQGLCAHFNAPGRTLVSQLEWLRDNGVIDPRLYEWADELRLAGNDAAHDVNETTSKEDAVDQIEFTRAILEHVFTFTEAFRLFKERRAARRTASRTQPTR